MKSGPLKDDDDLGGGAAIPDFLGACFAPQVAMAHAPLHGLFGPDDILEPYASIEQDLADIIAADPTSDLRGIVADIKAIDAMEDRLAAEQVETPWDDRAPTALPPASSSSSSSSGGGGTDGRFGIDIAYVCRSNGLVDVSTPSVFRFAFDSSPGKCAFAVNTIARASGYRRGMNSRTLAHCLVLAGLLQRLLPLLAGSQRRAERGQGGGGGTASCEEAEAQASSEGAGREGRQEGEERQPREARLLKGSRRLEGRRACEAFCLLGAAHMISFPA